MTPVFLLPTLNMMVLLPTLGNALSNHPLNINNEDVSTTSKVNVLVSFSWSLSRVAHVHRVVDISWVSNTNGADTYLEITC